MNDSHALPLPDRKKSVHINSFIAVMANATAPVEGYIVRMCLDQAQALPLYSAIVAWVPMVSGYVWLEVATHVLGEERRLTRNFIENCKVHTYHTPHGLVRLPGVFWRRVTIGQLWMDAPARIRDEPCFINMVTWVVRFCVGSALYEECF